jgi:hypothetical protein
MDGWFDVAGYEVMFSELERFRDGAGLCPGIHVGGVQTIINALQGKLSAHVNSKLASAEFKIKFMLLGLVTCECCDKIMRMACDLCSVRKYQKKMLVE